MVIHKGLWQDCLVSALVLPVAVMTADEGGLVALEVDVTERGVVLRGTDEPIDLVSLVKLIERGEPAELGQLVLELELADA